jgi:hypothetical protein
MKAPFDVHKPKKYLDISVPDPCDFSTHTDPQIRPGSRPDPNPTDPGGQKTTDPAPYILSLLIFYTTFRQIKVFAKNFREKFTKFRKNCGTFCKSFRFRERSKKVFIPTLNQTFPSSTVQMVLSGRHPIIGQKSLVLIKVK